MSLCGPAAMVRVRCGPVVSPVRRLGRGGGLGECARVEADRARTGESRARRIEAKVRGTMADPGAGDPLGRRGFGPRGRLEASALVVGGDRGLGRRAAGGDPVWSDGRSFRSRGAVSARSRIRPSPADRPGLTPVVGGCWPSSLLVMLSASSPNWADPRGASGRGGNSSSATQTAAPSSRDHRGVRRRVVAAGARLGPTPMTSTSDVRCGSPDARGCAACRGRINKSGRLSSMASSNDVIDGGRREPSNLKPNGPIGTQRGMYGNERTESGDADRHG